MEHFGENQQMISLRLLYIDTMTKEKIFMAQEATILAARSVQISTIISKIATLEGQISSFASSDTTNEMILVLEKLKKNVQDVLDTYAAVMKNKPITYQRKYAGKSAVTGANEAIESISSIQQALALAEACNKNRTNYADDEYAVVYKIQPGDTLSELAKKYNVSVDELCRLNNIKNRNLIRAGADLLIPITLPVGMALPMMISGVPLKHIGNTSGNNSSANNVSSASNSNAAKNGATSATDTGKANSQANTTPSTPTQSTTTGTVKFSVTQTGDKTVYQYDVKTQSQRDSTKKIKYGDGTLNDDGCGPTSLSTCLNALNGEGFTDPKKMCDYSSNHGAFGVGGTSMGKLFSEWCKDYPEYHYEAIFSATDKRGCPNDSEIKALIEALRQGKVGTLGTNHNGSSDKNIFAGAAHIVAVTGLEESTNGKIRLIISDPNAVNNSTYYNRCISTGKVEMIGDKTYVDLDVAAKYIRSIRIISK